MSKTKIRKTKNREKILAFLKKNDKPFTAQEIHSQLDSIDLATVYRNLNRLVEEGGVRELRISKKESMYEINEDGHEHAVCSECGKIRHVTVDKAELKAALQLSDFEIDDIEINIKGHCK